jgi:hypothetical protein
MKMEARTGLEPVNDDFADRSLTTWVPRPCKNLCHNALFKGDASSKTWPVCVFLGLQGYVC